jgi:glycosyltransferase involved in cell wall biosynthesis
MGGQKGIASFYRFFSRHLPVTLISTNDNEIPENFHGDFQPILSKSKWRYVNLFFLFKLGKLIKAKKATHLILEHPYLGWLGILAKWFFGVQLVIHSHNIESLRFKSTGKWWWRLLYLYEKRMHRRADVNFFITDEDKAYAVEHFRLNPKKCHTITYGFERKAAPEANERAEAKRKLQQLHHIQQDQQIMLFNGTLSYPPNLQALNMILKEINPRLRKEKYQPYSIIICGKDLPAELNNLRDFEDQGIQYAGFVPDINLYFLGSDIFLNPVSEGGGIKTKLVEALGFNLTCVSSHSGAIGIPQEIASNKLLIAPDYDAAQFVELLLQANNNENVRSSFFDYFYWENIALKAKNIIISTP